MGNLRAQAGAETRDEVRRAIFRQHIRLVQLLGELEDEAIAVGRGAEPDRLYIYTVALHGLLVRHLGEEESGLRQWLKDGGERGSTATSLLSKHAEQRTRIETLRNDRRVFSDPRTYAREVLALAKFVRQEIALADAELRALD